MIDIQKYKAMGFSNADIQEAIAEVQQEQQHESRLQQSYSQAKLMNSAAPNMSNTMVSGQFNQDNLIKWQLELDTILERVEHILKGDRPTMVQGNLIFIPTNDDRERIFNDYGVSEIMRILTMYLNRNTILSNYDETTILWKVLDFGKELNNLIFLKYEEMGWDTIEKRKRYPVIVREITDSVHSSYLRALNAGERESLRTARNVTQTQPIAGNPYDQMGGQFQMPKQRSIFNPRTWFAQT